MINFLQIVALIVVVGGIVGQVHQMLLENKLKYMDKLVDRGVQPNEACRQVFK